MNERQFAEALAGMLDVNRDAFTSDDDVTVPVAAYPRLFSESGMLTMNEGLTVVLADGSEFQLTIVQSAAPDTCAVCGMPEHGHDDAACREEYDG